MMNRKLKTFAIVSLGVVFLTLQATSSWASCTIHERACVLDSLIQSADKIDQQSWRDQAYREIAKTLAFDGNVDDALTLIDKIQTPDTKAMTIRGIGMAVADNDLTKEAYDEIFEKLRTAAEKIEHPPSYAIALTYVAMSQAFAGDDEGAWKTANDMENDALRHKAFGETAEIQAEKGKFKEAMKSIGMINSVAFRNKAYSTVSKILADGTLLQEAYEAALKITNDYKKTVAIQYVLDTQKTRDIEQKTGES